MSYDLLFIPKAPDQSWEDALGAAEEAAETEFETLDPGLWRTIVRTTTDVLGTVADTSRSPSNTLAHEPLGLDVSAYRDEITISLPYWWPGDEGAGAIRLMYRLGLELERLTGLAGYDQQLDSAIQTASVDDAIDVFRGESRRLKGGPTGA